MSSGDKKNSSKENSPRRPPLPLFRTAKNKLSLISKLRDTSNLGSPSRLEKESFENRNFQSLLSKVTFSSDDYLYDHVLSPGIAFYKFLAKRSNKTNITRLEVSIPDTIVFNESMMPVWIYTGEDGFVYRTETFHDHLIHNKFGMVEHPWEVVAVVKKPKWNNELKKYHGLSTYVLNSTDLKSRLNEFSSGEPCVIQRFIKSKGPVAFVCRTFYRKQGRCCVYVITNKVGFLNENVEPRKRCLTSTGEKDSTNIITSMTGRYLNETLPMVKKIAQFLEMNMGTEVLELACDFVKDESNKWWFTTCKAFKLGEMEPNLSGFIVDKPYWSSDSENDESEGNSMHNDYQRLKRCRLCQVYHPLSALLHQLTIKMITQTDQHLRERGVMIQWLDRAEYRHSGMATVYQSYPVCRDCYTLYELTEELKEIQRITSLVFSIPYKPTEVSYGEMPENWEFKSDTAVVMTNEKPKTVMEEARESKPMKLFRIVLILLGIEEISQGIKHDFSIKFSMFNIEQVYQLDDSKWKDGRIEMNKFRMFQFFANSRKEWKHYLNENNALSVYLCKGNKTISKVDLEMIDFRNPIVKHKKYYKVLSKNTNILGFLNCQLAIEEEGFIDVTNIKLQHISGLFVPPEDFILCLPLPDEWLEILPDISDPTEAIELTNHRPSLISTVTQHINTSSLNTTKALIPKPPPKRARAQSAHNKRTYRKFDSLNMNQSYLNDSKLTNLNDSKLITAKTVRARSASQRKKIWRLTIEVHTATGLIDPIEKKWKVVFKAFGSKYAEEEITRREHLIHFKFMKEIYIKCSNSKLLQTLMSEVIEFRIFRDNEIGKAAAPLEILRYERSVKSGYPVEMEGRGGVFLDVNLKLEESKSKDVEVMRVVGPGVSLVKVEV
ncbi:unnamed protein product [Blepharisma stoltei]|uniref:Uncharacterized protein n=1 Tax=Blepharisma stoltei TaxID=1481888 RepID=A0AAU9J938_9CILI|nr:unnamed protein product [Blepharisma stoltei]